MRKHSDYRVLFIVNMDENNKTGLFNATHQRIRALALLISEYKIYCLKYYDGFFISLFKKLLNKPIIKKEKEEFVYEGISYENLYLKNSLLRKLLFKLGIDLSYFICSIVLNRNKFKSFDLISAHWAYPQGGMAFSIYKLIGIPYVLSLHGSDIHSIPLSNKTLRKKTLKILDCSSNNFFLSSGLKENAKEIGYRGDNYSFLPNGVDTTRYYPVDEKESKRLKEKMELNGFVVGFVGNLVKVKRADALPYIFNEVKQILSKNKNVSFLVVGDGVLFEELKSQVSDFELNVRFTGKVNPEEVNKYMNLMDILLLPSRNEGWGNVVLEANACGTITIGSDRGGIPEAIGNKELIVPEGEHFENRFALKIVEVLEKGYDKAALIRRVIEQYSIEILARKETEKYREVLNISFNQKESYRQRANKTTIVINSIVPISKLQNILKKASKIGFFYLLSANMLLQIAGFGGQIFLTRILSVEDIGRIRILQSFLSIIIIIAGLGLNVAILKLCSENVDNSEKEKLFVIGFKISLISSIAFTTVMFLLVPLDIFSSDDVINNLMKYYIMQVPFSVMSTFAFSYLQAQKKIKKMSKIQGLSKLIIILMSTLAAYLFVLKGYILGIVISNAIATLLCFYLLQKDLKKYKDSKIEKRYVVKLFSFGSISFVTNLLGQLIFSLNFMILNYMSKDSVEIGYYGIAQLIVATLMIIPNSLSQIMIPHISEHSQSQEKIKGILQIYEYRMRLLMLVLFVGSYLIFPIFIPLVFGHQYSESIVYFKIQLVGMFFWSLYSPKGITLLSLGRVGYNLAISILAFTINIVTNIVFISRYGVIGAAIATALTYLISIFLNNYFFRKAIRKVYQSSSVSILDK